MFHFNIFTSDYCDFRITLYSMEFNEEILVEDHYIVHVVHIIQSLTLLSYLLNIMSSKYSVASCQLNHNLNFMCCWCVAK